MKKRLTELKEELKAGLPIDVDYYVKTGTNEIHAELIRNGLGIEQFSTTDGVEPIIELIRGGYAKERYETLKEHTDSRVRIALAEEGLYPEIFANDKHDGVRGTVAVAHPEYFEQIIPNANTKALVVVARSFYKQRYINAEHLRIYLERIKCFPRGLGLSSGFIEALQLKYEAAMAPAPLLVKTMDELSLYKLGDVHWVSNLTPEMVKDILYLSNSKLYFTDKEQFLRTWETMGTDAFWNRYGKL